MKTKEEILNKFDELKSVGNSNRIGKSDSVGNSNNIGKSDGIGNLGLSFKRVRGRREFMDLILEYIKVNTPVLFSKLNAYFQYTTGSSENMIKQAVAVLENVNLIESKDVFFEGGYDYSYSIK